VSGACGNLALVMKVPPTRIVRTRRPSVLACGVILALGVGAFASSGGLEGAALLCAALAIIALGVLDMRGARVEVSSTTVRFVHRPFSIRECDTSRVRYALIPARWYPFALLDADKKPLLLIDRYLFDDHAIRELADALDVPVTHQAPPVRRTAP
jgi:hypothetical protein